MATHSTNYTNTFIAVAPDCPATEGTAPKETASPSAVLLAFRLIRDNPYRFTSDDVLFTAWADRNGIAQRERSAARAAYFSKPQACLRASALGKRYGWGIHSDAKGRVALYGMESAAYASLASGRDPAGKPVNVTQAMRSKRASA